ncbi:hypothetical protein BGZ57DRAFT_1006231 [Hyaloscypha finlandica]|nr:hypothetical protein BGZ57DRAFT_1006231 [Hyaloscypha finlandica]
MLAESVMSKTKMQKMTKRRRALMQTPSEFDESTTSTAVQQLRTPQDSSSSRDGTPPRHASDTLPLVSKPKVSSPDSGSESTFKKADLSTAYTHASLFTDLCECLMKLEFLVNFHQLQNGGYPKTPVPFMPERQVKRTFPSEPDETTFWGRMKQRKIDNRRLVLTRSASDLLVVAKDRNAWPGAQSSAAERQQSFGSIPGNEVAREWVRNILAVVLEQKWQEDAWMTSELDRIKAEILATRSHGVASPMPQAGLQLTLQQLGSRLNNVPRQLVARWTSFIKVDWSARLFGSWGARPRLTVGEVPVDLRLRTWVE